MSKYLICFILIITYLAYSKSENLLTQEFFNHTNNKNGEVTVYYITSPSDFLKATFSEQNNALKTLIEYYTTKTLAQINSTGLYVSVGLGTKVMSGADLIMCYYNSSSKTTQTCSDYYVDPENDKLPVPDTNYTNGVNNVKLIDSSVEELDTSVKRYSVKFTFVVEKSFNNNDPYDWSLLKDWKKDTNKPTIGAFGPLKNDSAGYHQKNRSDRDLANGNGAPSNIEEWTSTNIGVLKSDGTQTSSNNSTSGANLLSNSFLYLFVSILLNLFL